MTPQVWAWIGTLVLALIGGGGATAWWKTLKDERRADRTEPVDLVARTLAMQVEQSDHLAQMQTRMTALFNDNIEIRGHLAQAKSESSEALRKAAHAEAETTRLRQALHWITDHIRPLIEWLDAGAKPPPPMIPEELRAYLAGETDTIGRRPLSPED